MQVSTLSQKGHRQPGIFGVVLASLMSRKMWQEGNVKFVGGSQLEDVPKGDVWFWQNSTRACTDISLCQHQFRSPRDDPPNKWNQWNSESWVNKLMHEGRKPKGNTIIASKADCKNRDIVGIYINWERIIGLLCFPHIWIFLWGFLTTHICPHIATAMRCWSTFPGHKAQWGHVFSFQQHWVSYWNGVCMESSRKQPKQIQ